MSETVSSAEPIAKEPVVVPPVEEAKTGDEATPPAEKELPTEPEEKPAKPGNTAAEPEKPAETEKPAAVEAVKTDQATTDVKEKPKRLYKMVDPTLKAIVNN